MFIRPLVKVDDGKPPRFVIELHDTKLSSDSGRTVRQFPDVQFDVGGICVGLKRRQCGCEVAVTGWGQALPRLNCVFHALQRAAAGCRKLRESKYYQLVALQALKELHT